jgi:hypothetical protein
MADWMVPFARAIDAAKKYVVSGTLDRADWNAELVRGDLGKAVQQLKRESGKRLLVGGVKLPLALAELGLIDEYDFVVHPRLARAAPRPPGLWIRYPPLREANSGRQGFHAFRVSLRSPRPTPLGLAPRPARPMLQV